MPLKHATETLLVLVLGLAIALAGICAAVFPPLPAGVAAWAIAFVLSILYPIALYPMFKSRRADYSFRVLHVVPFGLLLLRFLLDSLVSFGGPIGWARDVLTWGWTLPLVLLAFIALAWFCVSVIRQRTSRMSFLALIFVPFALFAVVSEQRDWNRGLTAAVTDPRLLVQSGSGVIAGMLDEEPGRRRGRRGEPVREGSAASVTGARSAVAVTAGATSSMPRLASSVSSRPPHLTSSGGEVSTIVLTFVAVYCGVVHERARRRALA